MTYALIILVISLEFTAAFAGLYHLKKYKTGTYTKYLVYVLFFVAITELLCTYSTIAKASEFKYFGFVEGTPFQRNYWIHNVQLIVTFSYFINYFRSRLRRGFLSRFMSVLIWTFAITAIINLFVTDVYFTSISKYTYITGSIFLMVSILVYYFELLQSDNLLNFNKSLTFYVSVGLLIYYLSITPLFIYNNYYNSESSKAFNNFYLYTLAVANVIMYGTFTLGFLLCKPNQRYS